MEWIDLSLPMQSDTVHWPGHPRYTVEDMMSMEQGEVMNVTSLAMCSHFGTHIDAPRHYVKDGTSVDELPVDVLMGPCRVVRYSGPGHISSDFIETLDLEGITRLLIRTHNSEFISLPKFREDYIALTQGAAKLLVEKGIRLLGVDGYSIGPFEPEEGVPVHQIFLGAGPDQVAIEEVDLANIDPGDYEIIALPMRLTGLEAAPARVMLGKMD